MQYHKWNTDGSKQRNDQQRLFTKKTNAYMHEGSEITEVFAQIQKEVKLVHTLTEKKTEEIIQKEAL